MTRWGAFFRHLSILFFLLVSFQLFAQVTGPIDDGSDGCETWTLEVCIVDECGDPLLLPYETLDQLDVVINNSTKVPTQVSQQDKEGCVSVTYYPPHEANVFNIRIVWNFQQNGCPETDLDCSGEEFTFGIDHEVIFGPNCHETITMTLSNYTWKNKVFLRTGDCERAVLNRLDQTIEICGDDPTIFLETGFIPNSGANGEFAVEFEIVNNNELEEDGSPRLVESTLIGCYDGRIDLLPLIFEYKEFMCEDEEGNPTVENASGLDLTNYLTPDPTCEEPSSITVNINLYCCSNDVPSEQSPDPFVSMSYTIIWQPDVSVPDPLFYFIAENDIVEEMNNGTDYDNGAIDDLLLNADNDPTQYTGDGPIVGRVYSGIGFDGVINNHNCIVKYEVELYEFFDCGIEDWEQATPITVDHDQDPATPPISRFDITNEVTANGYDALFGTLAVDPVFGESLIQLESNTCYYVKVIMLTTCDETIERYGRFQTASCNICKEVGSLEEREIKVFPTAVQDYLTIGSNLKFTQPVYIKVYDSSGRLMINSVDRNQSRFIHLLTHQLHTGLHFVEISIGHEQHVKKIFVR